MYNILEKNVYIKKFLRKNNLNKENFIYNNFFSNLKIYDKYYCYIEIFQNAGGNETHQLVKIFNDFYFKWLNKNFFNVDLIFKDVTNYGYKKTILYVENEFSFFLLKNESGIHRIIRKNPFSSDNKIQTSYLNIKIIPELLKINDNIKKNEIIIETFKSSGSGGQHINNTNSAIRIKHIPTNIVVNCQFDRSQNKNKINALKILNYKILLKKKLETKKFLNEINIKKKYIKTYYYNNNIVIDHISNKKIDLTEYFKLNIDFLNYDNKL